VSRFTIVGIVRSTRKMDEHSCNLLFWPLSNSAIGILNISIE
jgi:hypothetical protein